MDRREITFLNVGGWRAHLLQTGETLHILIDGVDITTRCHRVARWADGIHGDAWCWVRDAAGHIKLRADKDGPEEEKLSGLLSIEPGEAFL